jgi:hypothetical protein
VLDREFDRGMGGIDFPNGQGVHVILRRRLGTELPAPSVLELDVREAASANVARR